MREVDEAAKFDKIAIIGMGLLGGSIAKAARERGLVERISGYGRTESRLKFALENGIADEVFFTPEQASKGADLVIICTPVGLISEMIEKIAPCLKEGAVVTDVGSAKSAIVEKAEKTLSRKVFFVGGHPMAGSEETGVEASSASLFENALCVLTPGDGTCISALNRLEKFWEELKARVLIVSPQEHDLLVAASSHLAHIAAVALTLCVSGISADHEKVIPLLAGGFRDTTRVASGSPEMWRDICIDNRDRILTVIDRFSDTLLEISGLVKGGSVEELTRMFEDARDFRDNIPARSKGILELQNEIYVDVSDKPGVLGRIASSLGEAGINIRNINVRHVREFQGGALSIILEKDTDMQPAIDLLKKLGYSAKKAD